jgi:hypothetical protein
MSRRIPGKGAGPRPGAEDDAPLPAARRAAHVVLDVEMADGRAHLLLANCGDAVATEVRVTFSRQLHGAGGSVLLSALPLFERLGVLRPGQVLRVFWDSAPALLAGSESAPFTATVSWLEPGVARRVRRRATYRHDPRIYRLWPTSV